MTEKKFDSARLMREIREQLAVETADMDFAALRRYLDQQLRAPAEAGKRPSARS
jgi:hypothetical protein